MKQKYWLLLLPFLWGACQKEDAYYEKCVVGEWRIEEAYLQFPKTVLEFQDQLLLILPDNRVTLQLDGKTYHGVWDTRTDTYYYDEGSSNNIVFFELYLLDGAGEMLIEAEGELGNKKMTLEEKRDGECYVYKLKAQ